RFYNRSSRGLIMTESKKMLYLCNEATGSWGKASHDLFSGLRQPTTPHYFSPLCDSQPGTSDDAPVRTGTRVTLQGEPANGIIVQQDDDDPNAPRAKSLAPANHHAGVLLMEQPDNAFQPNPPQLLAYLGQPLTPMLIENDGDGNDHRVAYAGPTLRLAVVRDT